MKVANNVTANEAQQKIISSRGKNLIVTASAGCGKTTTMINRIVDLITVDHVPVQRLLVLTFTRASAEDMKKKLTKKLRDAAKTDRFAKTQLSLLDYADISTIDSFCINLLRTYYYKLEIDPAFQIHEEKSAGMIPKKLLDEQIAECYKASSPSFMHLSDAFKAGRRDDTLKKIILQLFAFCLDIEDPEKYLTETIFNSLSGDIATNPSCLFLTDYVRTLLQSVLQIDYKALLLCLNATNQTKNANDFSAHIIDMTEAVKEQDYVRFWQKVFAISPFASSASPSKSTSNYDEAHDFYLQYTAWKKKAKAALTEAQQMAELCLNMQSVDFSDSVELLKEIIFQTRTLHTTYAEWKKKRALLDFSDLGRLCIRLLSDEETAKEIRGCYDYLFVDECQDLSGIQNELIKHLTENGRLFMVGDVKQCIYRFRSAVPELFLSRVEEARANGSHEKLDINYRTNVKILQFVNYVFNRIMTERFTAIDYAKNEQLSGALTDCVEAEAPIETVCVCADGENATQNEANAVCEIIKRIVGRRLKLSERARTERFLQGKGDTVCHSDIAVLVRGKNSVAKSLSNLLQQKSIPTKSTFTTKLGQFPGVVHLVNLLKYLNNPYQDIPLVALLRGTIGGFTDDDLAAVRKGFPKEKF
ncbi:MAG: UvrD-helicase domain-containing protein, partial [Clostridia bacterium]|nr:UvrD-helicase domain-containing protein [Clostridia bacterium]